MPSTCALTLLLLALCAELSPASAQQHRGDRGNAPAASPPPRRAQRGQRPPAALPAPSKAGMCPAVGSSPTRPTRRYCLSDHSCPSAEKCCLLRDVRTCLLPAAGMGSCGAAAAGQGTGATGEPCSPAHSTSSLTETLGSPGGVSCRVSCCNETACGHGERCCIRCLRAEPGKVDCDRGAVLVLGWTCHGAEAGVGSFVTVRAMHQCCRARLALSRTLSPLSPPAKSGLCPRKRARRDAVCPNLCTDDRDCPGDKKCCFSGCGLSCTTPYTGTCCPHPHSSPSYARGVHPPARVCTPHTHLCTPHACHRGRMGAGWRPEGSWGRGTLQPRAMHKAQVPGAATLPWAQRGCDAQGCDAHGRSLAAKSGACPVVLRGSLGPCLERCDSDADCPGAKKCCTTGCGHVCKLPTEGKSFVPWGRDCATFPCGPLPG